MYLTHNIGSASALPLPRFLLILFARHQHYSIYVLQPLLHAIASPCAVAVVHVALRVTNAMTYLGKHY